MLEKIFAAAGKAAAFLCIVAAAAMLPAAAAELFVKRGRVQSEKFGGDLYILGKKINPKTVFIINVTPVNFAKNVIKRHFNG
ncbi:MAG: hypothetical protein K2K34_01545 [Oscillospiraceae bacterium]|nr:hypothetical protein [Oscillospiraceae bacterium]